MKMRSHLASLVLDPFVPACALVWWWLYSVTPPRGRVVVATAYLKPEIREVHLRLNISEVVREQVRWILQSWKLDNTDVAALLSLLHPERLYIKVFHLATAEPHDDTLGRA